MKITIPRRDLKEAVAGFNKIINGHVPSLPILGCIRLEACGKFITAQASNMINGAEHATQGASRCL